MDFKDFCNQEVNANSSEDKIKIKRNISDKDKENITKEAEKSLNEYSNMSQQELMEELIKKTDEKKQDGSLSSEKMEQMYKTILNLLPPENRQNLDKIFNKLK